MKCGLSDSAIFVDLMRLFFPVCVELSLDDSVFEDIKNPLEEVTAGLLDSTGHQLPLQAVYVKCKLMDLLSQVKQNRTEDH